MRAKRTVRYWLSAWILIGTMSLAGCGAEAERAEETEAVSEIYIKTSQEFVPETEDRAKEAAPQDMLGLNMEPETTSQGYQKLTAEIVKELAQKHDELQLEDFAPYMSVTFSGTGTIYEQLYFEYEGREFCLRVIASNKRGEVVPYEGDLDAAVLFPKEYLSLLTSEAEYAYTGYAADIRAGQVEHILEGTVSMEDYLICDPPAGLVLSPYKNWMGTRGGCAFVPEGQQDMLLTSENTGLFSGANTEVYGGIDIYGVQEVHWETVLKDWGSPIEGDVKVHRVKVRMENGKEWYVAYTEKPGSTISYYVYLNPQMYTEQDFLKLTETIIIKENAIY